MTRFYCITILFLQTWSVALRAQITDTLPMVQITAPVLDRSLVGQRLIGFDEPTRQSFAQQSLAQLLSQQTAMPPRSYGVASALVSLRGGAASHTAVVWNGINLQNALSGYADFSIFPVGAFSDIRVKMGGESAMFGSGAVSGVILLNNETPDNGWHGNAGLSFGSYRDRRQMIDLSCKKRKTSLQGTLLRQYADNDFEFKNTAKIGSPKERLPNAQSTGGHILLHAHHEFSDNIWLDMHGWWLDQDRQIPPTMTTLTDSARQQDQSMRLTSRLQVGRWVTRLAWIDDELRYQSLTVPPSNIRGQTLVAESEAKWPIRLKKHALLLQTGVNYTKNIAISNNFDQHKTRERMALFASNTLKIKSLETGLSIRQEMVDQRLAPLTGSVGIKKTCHVTSKSVWTLRSALARNYNLPAMNDLYWIGLGNPDLKAEKGWSGELGLDGFSSTSGYPLWISNYSLTLFHTVLQDRIQWAPTNATLWRPTNLPHSIASGAEFALHLQQLQIKRQTTWLISGDLAYNFTYTRDENGFPLLYVPRHTAQATLTVSRKSWMLRWRQTAADGRPMSRDNQVRTRPYTLSNAELIWQKKPLRITLSVQNIFNTPYQVIQYYPMPGRLLNLQAMYQF